MTEFFGAAHALIAREDRYLVTRRAKDDDYMPLKWDIPGGSVDPGESMEEALIREVAEETRLEVDIRQPLYVHTNLGTLPERQTFQVVYLCSYVSGEPELDPLAHDEYRWMNKPEIEELDAIAFLDGLRRSMAYRSL